MWHTFLSNAFCRRFVSQAAWLLAFMAVASSLPAQERLTGATLAAWGHTGGAPRIDDTGGGVIVPAGGQLARAYSGDRVTVRLVTRPFFSDRNENWPALEIGPASLSFVRDAGGGGIVLLGDTALHLPETIVLGSDGRSVRSLDLLLSYDRPGGTALLTLDATSHSVPAITPFGTVEVALSAGAENAFMIDLLEITVAPALAVASPGKAADTPATKSKPTIEKTSRREAFGQARALAAQNSDDRAEEALTAANRAKPGSPAWHSETAHALVMLAIDFSQKGRFAIADRIAQRALKQIELATRKAAKDEPAIAANAFELGAFVEERFLGDWTRAKESHRRALEAWPEAASAKERLKHIEDTEQEARHKGPGRG